MMKALRKFLGQKAVVYSVFVLCGLSLTTGCSVFKGLFGGGAAKDDPTFSQVDTTPGGAPTTGLTVKPEGFVLDELVMVSFSGLDPMITPLPHQERIKSDGTITLPNIGAIKAVGKSPGQLQTEIRNAYVPRYYNANLTVTVTPGDRFVYVRGEVRTSGRVPYTSSMTVTKAIAGAGDFNEFASKTKVELTRNGQTVIVDCASARRDPKLDVAVYPNDQLYVPRRWP